MGKRRFTAQQIINMLREAEVLLNQDSTVGEVCRESKRPENYIFNWTSFWVGLNRSIANQDFR